MADLQLRLTVEGRDVTVSVPEHWTLDRLLRERLHLSRVRRECGVGECDACAVRVDDELVRACVVLAAHTGGRRVTLEPDASRADPTLELAHALHVAVVRSPLPAARILKLDPRAAVATAGVVDVVTAADVPNNRPIADWPVLAADRVTHPGQAVALVVAESPDAAALGASRVTVQYEPSPSVGDAASAIGPDAPEVVLGASNIAREWNVEHGDPPASGTAIVVERLYRFPPAPISARGASALAWVTPDGLLRVKGSNEGSAVASMLGLPHNRVRAVGQSSAESAFHAALAAWRTGRPAIVDGEVEARTAMAALLCRTAASSDGRLVSHDVQLLIDVGAPGPSPIGELDTAIAGPYTMPHTRLRARAVRTNTPPAHIELAESWLTLAIESQLDLIARQLRLDPVAVRSRNLDPRHAAALAECRSAVVESLGERLEPSAPHRRIGRGLALAMHPLIPDLAPAFASVTIETDGSVSVGVGGAADSPALAILAAQELGTTASDVVVHEVEPPSGRSNNSWLAVGHAVQRAARELRQGAGQAIHEHVPDSRTAHVAFAAHAADVEVDTETGVVRLIRHAACHELGHVVDSTSAVNAIRRDTVSGIRFALPTPTDIEIAIRTLQMSGGPGPDGARPIGNTAFAAAAAAVFAAVNDVSGAGLERLPIQWDEVLSGMIVGNG